MITVGVTGGIGSGKTTFCREWEKLGAYVFYADDEAKKLMVNSENVVSQIKKAFGSQSYNKNGTLNKPHLIREAFDTGRVEELNQIVHPAVAKAFKEACEKARIDGYKVAVEEAALLLNSGRPGFLDKVIIVSGDESVRIKRVVKRDQSTSQKIKSRIQHQPDFRQKYHLADYIVTNNGTVAELKKKAKDLYHQIVDEPNLKQS